VNDETETPNGVEEPQEETQTEPEGPDESYEEQQKRTSEENLGGGVPVPPETHEDEGK